MTQKSFLAQWDHLRQVVGVGLRAVEALPETQLDAHPIPRMRTPKQLAFHQFATLSELLEGLVRGDIKDAEDADAARLRSKAELVKFCHDSWTAANRAALTITDEKLGTMVKTPWGRDLPAAVIVVIATDEFLHHRGQMYAFVRALGGEVPEMWDFKQNAEEFQPRAVANA
jgi:uncharacterized damage-inducible protein DinB